MIHGAGELGKRQVGIQILYIEDDARAAGEVQDLISRNGEQVVWEATGAGGLHRAGRERFDVIVLDRMLPDLDGMTVLKRMCESGIGTPVLMLSALGRSLNPGERETFNQLFLSGTGASIALSAPTGDRLALKVLDPQAKPICTDETGKGALCHWVPLFTQRYTIEVTNLGKDDARYFLVVQ